MMQLIRKKSILSALALQCGGILLGVALGGWLLVAVLIPRIGLGEVERIRQLALHIHECSIKNDNHHQPLTVLLGDSITREGVDAAFIQEHCAVAGEAARFENWAISGCSLAEQRLQLPLVLEAKPDVVVFALGPSTLCHLQDLPLDKAYAYAYSGFVAANRDTPSSEMLAISHRSMEALRSSRWQQHLHFRSAPKSWLNQTLRHALKGRSQPATANWPAPFRMDGSVGRQQLQWHIELVEGWWAPDRSKHLPQGEKLLSALAAETRAAGAVPVFALIPVHPGLEAAATPLWRDAWPIVERVAKRNSAVAVDARYALDASDFADALHPNAAGRQRYSRLLAAGLASPIRTARK